MVQVWRVWWCRCGGFRGAGVEGLGVLRHRSQDRVDPPPPYPLPPHALEDPPLPPTPSCSPVGLQCALHGMPGRGARCMPPCSPVGFLCALHGMMPGRGAW